MYIYIIIIIIIVYRRKKNVFILTFRIPDILNFKKCLFNKECYNNP